MNGNNWKKKTMGNCITRPNNATKSNLTSQQALPTGPVETSATKSRDKNPVLKSTSTNSNVVDGSDSSRTAHNDESEHSSHPVTYKDEANQTERGKLNEALKLMNEV
jgi:hypothetical protein